MRIIFDLVNTSLGLNGGSYTICKSANILQKLGCDVSIVDSDKNKHTWVKLEVPHLIVKNNINKIPDADFIIGTGFRSWSHVLNTPSRCGKKILFIRGWELWNASENRLLNIISNKKLVKIVNSIGLQNKLKKNNIESTIIRPGNDFDLFYPLNIRNQNDIILGGLYHTKHSTKRSDWVIKTKQELSKKYKNLKLFMYGASKKSSISEIDYYIRQPSLELKNELYNKVDIWLSPSNLEGLHIVPQEALLTKCAVVTTNAELAGTQDYVKHKITGLVSKDSLKDFIKKTENLINDIEARKQLGENGRNKIIELGSREDNMKKLISFLETI